MAEVVKLTRYKCSKCGALYGSQTDAESCESRPITKDKGAKVGDIVTILNGEGAGQKAKVTNVHVIDREWGHYAWERYWHTVSVTADLVDGYGTRHLTFDSYKV